MLRRSLRHPFGQFAAVSLTKRRVTPPLSSAPAAFPLTLGEFLLPILILLLLQAAEIAIVSPTGEFPIMDDWAFARIAKRWAESGGFAYVGSNEMVFVAQAGLGALFIKLFGFSFTGLRWLGIGLAFLSLVALYGCGREMGLQRRAAVLLMLAVAVTPLHIYMSYSFMTEIPFQFLFLGALWGYLRFVRTGSMQALAVATALAFGAFLVRQPAVLLPIGAAAYSFHARGRPGNDPKRRRQVYLTSLGCLAAMGVVLAWRSTLADLDYNEPMLVEFFNSGARGWFAIMEMLTFRLFFGLQYLGLFSLPVLAALAGPALTAARRRPRLAFGSLGTILLLTALTFSLPGSVTNANRSMPYLNQLLNVRPLGTDGTWFRGTGPRLFGRISCALLTLACVPGATLLLGLSLSFAAELHRQRRLTTDAGNPGADPASPTAPSDPSAVLPSVAGFCYMQWLLQFAFIALVYRGLCERYFLLLLAPALLLIVYLLTVPRETVESAAAAGDGEAGSEPSPHTGKGSPRSCVSPSLGPRKLAAFAVLAAAFLAFSLAGLHDWFTLHHEVTAAVNELRDQSVPANLIDAGFAWNGWFNEGPVRLLPRPRPFRRAIWYLDRYFPRLKDEYVISVAREPARAVIGRRRYRAWLALPPKTRDLWILGPQTGLRRSIQGKTDLQWNERVVPAGSGQRREWRSSDRARRGRNPHGSDRFGEGRPDGAVLKVQAIGVRGRT